MLVLGATFIVNGAVDLFIEWYTRDSEEGRDDRASVRLQAGQTSIRRMMQFAIEPLFDIAGA